MMSPLPAQRKFSFTFSLYHGSIRHKQVEGKVCRIHSFKQNLQSGVLVDDY